MQPDGSPFDWVGYPALDWPTPLATELIAARESGDLEIVGGVKLERYEAAVVYYGGALYLLVAPTGPPAYAAWRVAFGPGMGPELADYVRTDPILSDSGILRVIVTGVPATPEEATA